MSDLSAKHELSPVVVTGMGIVSPFGVGVASFCNALHDTACCVRQTMDFPELKSPFLISEINDFDLRCHEKYQ